jgi:hypothetical protein
MPIGNRRQSQLSYTLARCVCPARPPRIAARTSTGRAGPTVIQLVGAELPLEGAELPLEGAAADEDGVHASPAVATSVG